MELLRGSIATVSGSSCGAVESALAAVAGVLDAAALGPELSEAAGAAEAGGAGVAGIALSAFCGPPHAPSRSRLIRVRMLYGCAVFIMFPLV